MSDYTAEEIASAIADMQANGASNADIAAAASAAGVSVSEIAAATGVDSGTISQIFQDAGVAPAPEPAPAPVAVAPEPVYTPPPQDLPYNPSAPEPVYNPPPVEAIKPAPAPVAPVAPALPYSGSFIGTTNPGSPGTYNGIADSTLIAAAQQANPDVFAGLQNGTLQFNNDGDHIFLTDTTTGKELQGIDIRQDMNGNLGVNIPTVQGGGMIQIATKVGDNGLLAPVNTSAAYNIGVNQSTGGFAGGVNQIANMAIMATASYFLPGVGELLATELGVSTTVGTALAQAGLQLASGADPKTILVSALAGPAGLDASGAVSSQLSSLINDPNTLQMASNAITRAGTTLAAGGTGKDALTSAAGSIVQYAVTNATGSTALGAGAGTLLQTNGNINAATQALVNTTAYNAGQGSSFVKDTLGLTNTANQYGVMSNPVTGSGTEIPGRALPQPTSGDVPVIDGTATPVGNINYTGNTPVSYTGATGPVAPGVFNLTPTGTSDSPPGTIFPNGDIVLPGGQTVSTTDLQNAMNAGQPIAVNGVMNAGLLDTIKNMFSAPAEPVAPVTPPSRPQLTLGQMMATNPTDAAIFDSSKMQAIDPSSGERIINQSVDSESDPGHTYYSSYVSGNTADGTPYKYTIVYDPATGKVSYNTAVQNSSGGFDVTSSSKPPTFISSKDVTGQLTSVPVLTQGSKTTSSPTNPTIPPVNAPVAPTGNVAVAPTGNVAVAPVAPTGNIATTPVTPTGNVTISTGPVATGGLSTPGLNLNLPTGNIPGSGGSTGGTGVSSTGNLTTVSTSNTGTPLGNIVSTLGNTYGNVLGNISGTGNTIANIGGTGISGTGNITIPGNVVVPPGNVVVPPGNVVVPPGNVVVPPGNVVVPPGNVVVPPGNVVVPPGNVVTEGNVVTDGNVVVDGSLIPIITKKPSVTGNVTIPTTGGFAMPTTQGALVNPGLNPGYIQATPAYQTTNPVQSKFYWGQHPYAIGPADIGAYNYTPQAPATPWGAQQALTGPVTPAATRTPSTQHPIQTQLHDAWNTGDYGTVNNIVKNNDISTLQTNALYGPNVTQQALAHGVQLSQPTPYTPMTHQQFLDAANALAATQAVSSSPING